MDPMTAIQASQASWQQMHQMCHRCPMAHHPLLGMMLILLWAGIMLVNFTQIFRKAGWPWALGLLMVVPVVNVVMLFILGFAKWPIQKCLEAGRKEEPPK